MFEIVSLFGLMVSALLIVNTTSENKSRIYLSLFFLSISIFSLTRNFIFYVNHPYILYYFLPGAIPFFNLSAPLLYLYIKKSLSLRLLLEFPRLPLLLPEQILPKWLQLHLLNRP